jgi:PAS domain S-box-containing protein
VLSNSTATVEQLIDAAPDAIVVVDVAGVVVRVNQRAERLLGFDREEVTGRSFVDLLTGHDQSTDIDKLTQLAEAPPQLQATTYVEVTVQRKDGVALPVEVTLNGLETGDRRFVVAALRDVSGRRRADTERDDQISREQLARLEAEAAIQLRDAFLATVVHDLNQPLSLIKLRAQLIRELTAELGDHPTVEQIDAWSRRIEHTSASMEALLRELLDVSRLQIGEPLTLRRSSMDLSSMVTRAAEQQQVPNRRPIRVDVPDYPVVGVWDRHRLERVVYNLLGNALKYSPHDGQVTLTVRLEDRTAVLEVRDEGIGVPAEDVDRIFRWFQRGSNAARVAPGTGLGLAGVRQIVEQHGGTISVQSEEHRGSTFTVQLPTWNTAERN